MQEKYVNVFTKPLFKVEVWNAGAWVLVKTFATMRAALKCEEAARQTWEHVRTNIAL